MNVDINGRSSSVIVLVVPTITKQASQHTTASSIIVRLSLSGKATQRKVRSEETGTVVAATTTI
jgi:hypothetical protein